MGTKTSSDISARTAFAYALRHLRQEKGWSQEFLAAKVGLHRTYVGSVERGERNISIDNIEKFARALGCTVGKLFETGGI